jgi:predicted DNA-binding protein (MmcQ/YjbR family)
MSRADLLAHALSLPGAWIDDPWGDDQVAKVGDRIFAFLGAPDGTTIGLKCGASADEAREWRDQYPDDVTVSRYVGRYGWNTFVIGSAISDDELREAIDTSYADVVSRLPRSKRPPAGSG